MASSTVDRSIAYIAAASAAALGLAVGVLYSKSCSKQCSKTFKSKPKLTYFNGRGLAEVSRLMFKDAGVEFTDVREEKIDHLKQSGILPFGQVPILEVNGKVISQSNAIARYVARKLGYYGCSPCEGAEIDMLLDCIVDIRMAYSQKVRALPEAQQKEAKAKFAAEDVTKWFGLLEARLIHNGVTTHSGWATGKSLSVADFALFTFPGFLANFENGDKLLNAAPVLKSLGERVAARPRVAEWVKVRPVTPF